MSCFHSWRGTFLILSLSFGTCSQPRKTPLLIAFGRKGFGGIVGMILAFAAKAIGPARSGARRFLGGSLEPSWHTEPSLRLIEVNKSLQQFQTGAIHGG